MATGLMNVGGKVWPSGTPQAPFSYTRESVCAQTLPAFAAAGFLRRANLPTTDLSNTAGAVVFLPLPDNNVVELKFLCRHDSDITNKAATARLWLVTEAQVDEGPNFNVASGEYFEHEFKAAGDLTIATGGTPPILAAADSVLGGAQTAFADSLTFASQLDSVKSRTEGVAAGVAASLSIDYHGYRGIILALNVGTMNGIRIGSRCF
jgi:hypothetical protein